MEHRTAAMSSGIVLAAGLLAALAAQSSQAGKEAAVAAHIEAARKAAGKEHTGIFEGICTQFAKPAASRPPAPARTAPTGRPARSGPPDRATWHAEPVKVFDNLYFVGEKEYGAWAVTTVGARPASTRPASPMTQARRMAPKIPQARRAR